MSDPDLPIDRGWAWVILFGTTLIQLVTVGCLKAFGLIYAEFLEYFQSSAGSTAWVLSLAVFLLMSCGTLSANLGRRFGFRAVLLGATVISSIGYSSSAFVPSLEWLFLTMGVLTGFGVGLTYTPTVIMVTVYFQKRRSLANGISVAGNCVGFFLYPFLINYLLEEYALRGTLIILGGVILHSCIGAMLLVPLDTFKKKKHSKELKIINSGIISSEPSEKLLANSAQGHDTANSVEENERYLLDGKTAALPDSPANDETSMQIKKRKSNSDIETEMMLEENHKGILANGTEKDPNSGNSGFSCRNCIKGIFDYTYLCNPVFVLYGCSFAFANMSYTNLFLVIPPHARMCHVGKSDVALLVSLSGLSDLFGRLAFGWISDLKFVKRRYVYIVGMLAGGGSALLAPLATNFGTIAAYSCWYGFFGGSYWSLVAPLLADSFGVEKIPIVFGLTTSFISIPSLLSPPLLGIFRDITGDWSVSFRIAGVWMILAGVFALMLPLGERYLQKKETINVEAEAKEIRL